MDFGLGNIHVAVLGIKINYGMTLFQHIIIIPTIRVHHQSERSEDPSPQAKSCQWKPPPYY